MRLPPEIKYEQIKEMPSSTLSHVPEKKQGENIDQFSGAYSKTNLSHLSKEAP